MKHGGIVAEATNLSAATRYYPTVSGNIGRDTQHKALLAVYVATSGGVTLTFEATIEDPDRDKILPANLVWIDVTTEVFRRSTAAKGAASFVDVTDMLLLNVTRYRRVRIKSVTADASNAVRIVELSNDEPDSISSASGLATEVTLAAVLAKLPDDAATQTTLAAVLAYLANLAAESTVAQPTVWTAVTKSDATDLTALATKGLLVGGAGDLAVRLVGAPSTTVTLAVQAGQYVPGKFTRVMAATTATGIVALS